MKGIPCPFLFCVAFYITYNELRRHIQLEVVHGRVNDYSMVMV